MSKTRIFVSSTCYDLAAEREELRGHLVALGHEPLLSEYPSFPVNPSESAIGNCRKNVREHTDILILIVGGRRGFLDGDSGKSVTNLEYETARQSGIPCFVFVGRSVNTLFPVWKKNPEADFTPIVDFPAVFSFIERIRNENRWIFSFEKTADIKEILTVQLSIMLRELLLRSRAGTLDSLADYALESPKAQQLARERPRFWEHLLTGELLTYKLNEVRRQYERVHKGLAPISSRPVTAREFMSLTRAKMHDLTELATAFKGQLAEITLSWGPLGQPGDPHAIMRSVNDFINIAENLIRWEEELTALSPPGVLIPLKGTMRRWTEVLLIEMERLPKEILKPFEAATPPSGTLEINLTIGLPNFEPFNSEMARLEGQPWLLEE